MKFQVMHNLYYVNKPEGFQPKNKQEFIDGIMNAKTGAEINVKQMNSAFGARYAESGRVFPPFKDSMSGQEKQRRAELSDRLRRKMATNLAELAYERPAPGPTNERYPEELMMSNDLTKNTLIHGLITDLSGLKSKAAEQGKDVHILENEYLKLHSDMLAGLEDPDCTELIKGDLTDEQLVDNFDRIRKVSTTVTQFENFVTNFEKNGIKRENLDEEGKRLYDNCFRIMGKYEPYRAGINILENKLGLIENPYYSVVDINDPDTKTTLDSIFTNNDVADPDQIQMDLNLKSDPVKGMTNLNELVTYNGSLNSLEREYDVTAAKDALIGNGVKEENLAAKVIGGDGREYPLDRGGVRQIIDQLRDNPGINFKLYDKTKPDDPETSLEIHSGHDHIYKDLIGNGHQFKELPEKPDPVEPAAKPGGWASFWNKVTFGRAYKDDFRKYNEYEQYKKDEAAYQKSLYHTKAHNMKWGAEFLNRVDHLNEQDQPQAEQNQPQMEQNQPQMNIDNINNNEPEINNNEPVKNESDDIISEIEKKTNSTVPDRMKENIHAMYNKSEQSKKDILNSENDIIKGVDDKIYDIAAYSFIKQSVKKNKITKDDFQALSKKETPEELKRMVKNAPSLSYLTLHPHAVGFYKENVFSQEGMEKLGNNIINDAEKAIKNYEEQAPEHNQVIEDQKELGNDHQREKSQYVKNGPQEENESLQIG